MSKVPSLGHDPFRRPTKEKRNALDAWLKSVLSKSETERSIEFGLDALRASLAKAKLQDEALIGLAEYAGAVSKSQPESALAITDAIAKASRTLPPGISLLRGVLFDQLGRRTDAGFELNNVLLSAASTPSQRLRAANLLIRYGGKYHQIAMSHAVEAYAKLGRPITQASRLLYMAQLVADFPLIDALVDQINYAYSLGKFAEVAETPRTNLLWCDNEEINYRVLQLYYETNIQKGEPLQSSVPFQLHREGRQNGRTKIGYLSSDFREHPTAKLILGLLRNHDREKFEIHLFCSGWNDGSSLRKECERHSDFVHSISSFSDAEASKRIKHLEIDVLVELNGPTRANRIGILRYRPAPVIVNYLGWPGPINSSLVDYTVADEYTLPSDVQRTHTERIIRIDSVYQINDYQNTRAPVCISRTEAGLEGVVGPVAGVFNNINKVTSKAWSTWMEIMRRVPNLTLWILDPGEVAQNNLRNATLAQQVDAKRIRFAPRLSQAEHLNRLTCCDLMLDPWPYGGHTSTSDAIFAGVPVIALKGMNFASRVSPALLVAAKMEHLACSSVEQYIDTAVDLLSSNHRIEEEKRKLLENIKGADIFNSRSKTRQLESAFTHALNLALDGKNPKNITVKREINSRQHLNQIAQVGQDAPTPKTSKCLTRTQLQYYPKIILVCGPWGSGTSAVAGMLARAGLQAPGPFVQVNDPRTNDTYEMKAFQTILRSLASEQTLERLTSESEAYQRLQVFRDEILRSVIEQTRDASPIMLKHGLAALFLKELCALFEVQVVGVIRPLASIEATRLRRQWWPSMGKAGAQVIYRALFDHLIEGVQPFHLVRYPKLLADPNIEFDKLMGFCGLKPSHLEREAALAFLKRPV